MQVDMQSRLNIRWRASCSAFASACHGLGSRNSDYFAHISRLSFLSSKPSQVPVRSHRLSAKMRLEKSDRGDAAQRMVSKDRNAPPRRPKRYATGALSSVGSMTPVIQWYPGHIAKAERSLKESIKMVDVVIEVRDCRIPIATAHPEVPMWIGNKNRILAMNRADLAPLAARSDWRRHLLENGEKVRFIDAKQGRGVRELKKLAMEASSSVNQKRKSRGLLPRPVRCLVIGYPNVGKSALINRLVGRRSTKSANKPGVTRNFQWVRISDTIELLDMPGIIPAKFVSQDTALRLAICDDIGQAAYDTQLTASLMIDELKRVAMSLPGYFDFDTLEKRFRLNPREMSGEEFLYRAAETLYNGDAERTAVRLLTEFRSGVLGPAALESPNMLSIPLRDVITDHKSP